MKRHLRLLILPAVLITFAFSSMSCGDDDGDDNNPMNPGGGNADVTISIDGGMSGNFTPSPANMTVGQTVRWKNDDVMPHSAVHQGGAFNTGTLQPGATSQVFTMSTAGTFNYLCTVPGHTMTGQIVVAP